MSEINEDTRSLLRVVLEMWGFDVVEAVNADESRVVVERDHLSLILMDTTYPFDDTLRSLHSLHELDSIKDVPVILFSGYVGTDYRTAALENGASGFLVKPVDLGFLERYCKSIAASRSAALFSRSPSSQPN